MKHTSPTLLVIAALAIVPGLSALDVKDDDVKLGLALQLQIRADVSDAENAAGDDYDATTGTNNSAGDPVDFYLRRARFGLKGTWKGDYKFALVFAADKAQAKDQPLVLYEGYVTRIWKAEDSSISHELKAGQSTAFFNGAVGSISSSNFLLPGQRATEGMLNSRGSGVGYMLHSPVAKFGADIQNNTSDAAGDEDGLFYSARVELTPPGELGIAKVTESFAGKEGKGVLLALDYGSNVRDDNTTTTTGYGIELLGHVDGLTALIEYRTQTAENMTTDTEVEVEVMVLQAGYALPLGDAIIEPAVRYQTIDNNTENEEEGANFGTKYDFGGSGTQIDLGVNYYIHEHKNKVQLAYTMWTGEKDAAGDEASANILRAQWQLAF